MHFQLVFGFKGRQTLGSPLCTEAEMSNRFITIFQSIWSNPLWGYGATLILLVVANRMSTSISWSNAALGTAWIFLVLSVARTSPLPQQPLLSRVLWTALFGAGCGLVLYYTLWSEPPPQSKKEKRAIPDPLLASQIQELKLLQEFIGGKNEGELWELFDLQGITRYNIRRAKTAISETALSPEEAAEINEFFKDGQANLDARYCKVIRTKGGFHTEPIPGKLGILNLSKKYVTGRQMLAKFQSSAQLPPSVQDAVKELDVAVATNVAVLLDVINERLADKPNEVLREEDGNSPLFGATSGAFLDKRIWLKPKQEAIMSAMSDYLNAQ